MQLPFKVNARAPSLYGTVYACARIRVQLADGNELEQERLAHHNQRKQKAEAKTE